mmetsp:Transcript_35292/g.77274  ORF Transcript_35292/g.77274 Transcript_35292/m.77274 type:complete len:238 (+) Transcript_35292:290-1003(+)
MCISFVRLLERSRWGPSRIGDEKKQRSHRQSRNPVGHPGMEPMSPFLSYRNASGHEIDGLHHAADHHNHNRHQRDGLGIRCSQMLGYHRNNHTDQANSDYRNLSHAKLLAQYHFRHWQRPERVREIQHCRNRKRQPSTSVVETKGANKIGTTTGCCSFPPMTRQQWSARPPAPESTQSSAGCRSEEVQNYGWKWRPIRQGICLDNHRGQREQDGGPKNASIWRPIHLGWRSKSAVLM